MSTSNVSRAFTHVDALLLERRDGGCVPTKGYFCCPGANYQCPLGYTCNIPYCSKPKTRADWNAMLALIICLIVLTALFALTIFVTRKPPSDRNLPPRPTNLAPFAAGGSFADALLSTPTPAAKDPRTRPHTDIPTKRLSAGSFVAHTPPGSPPFPAVAKTPSSASTASSASGATSPVHPSPLRNSWGSAPSPPGPAAVPPPRNRTRPITSSPLAFEWKQPSGAAGPDAIAPAAPQRPSTRPLSYPVRVGDTPPTLAYSPPSSSPPAPPPFTPPPFINPAVYAYSAANRYALQSDPSAVRQVAGGEVVPSRAFAEPRPPAVPSKD
ncbi:hypothetical protein HDU96_004325 [Phlyctochytrium bullatum]|nr:hypothetical protein HDU96_004325 [Phlyctochytrium bullatum]